MIALADAIEENQDRLLQSFSGLKSATHLLILLIRLWQRLSADQTAILEAAFLPLQEDTQELVRTLKSHSRMTKEGWGWGWYHMAIYDFFLRHQKKVYVFTKKLFSFSSNHNKSVI